MSSLNEKLLLNMAALNQNFHISKSKLSGDFDTKTGILLHVDTAYEPETWKARDKVSGDQIPVTELTGTVKTLIVPFVLQYKEEKAFLENEEKTKKEEKKAASKNPLDNLTGFEGLPEESAPIVNDSPTENPQVSDDEKAREFLAQKQQEEAAKQAVEANKRKLEMMEQAEQEEQAAVPPKKEITTKNKVEAPVIFTDRPVEYVDAPGTKIGEVNLFDVLTKICKNDLMQIFGNTGTGKTSICTRLALDARAKNKSVLYIDTEGSINDDQIKAMKKTGTQYEFIKQFPKLCEAVKRLPKVDVVIIDSGGVPALAAYCKANLGGQGEVLKKFIAMSDDLKTYATENNSLVVVINQPESSMGKGEDVILEPWGEKSRYYFKEILKTNYAKRGRRTEKTTLVLRAHRSRCMGIDKVICTIEVTDEGIKAVA